MTEESLGVLLERALRQIIREEVTAALTGTTPATPKGPKHVTLGPNAHRPQPQWEDIDEFRLQGTGTRTYTVTKGHPIKVKGEGRSGAVGSGFTVIRISRHRESGEINVECRKDRNGHTRIFKTDRLVYQRPKKGA